MPFISAFEDIGSGDVATVGGKNASLGEMTRTLSSLGVAVPAGFAIRAEAYRQFIAEARLEPALRQLLAQVRIDQPDTIVACSARVQELMLGAALSEALKAEIREAYRRLSAKSGEEATDVAVRSSATAEDLPNASFAGQQESFLNVRGEAQLLDSVKRAYASLFTPRAIHYRQTMGFDHLSVALSAGVQKMVRSDLASAGVIFTLDPDSGHRGVVLVTSSYGLGESVVQGRVNPDQFWLHKATLHKGFDSLFRRELGTKAEQLINDSGATHVRVEAVSAERRGQWSLSDAEVVKLARWSMLIEEHYSRQRDVETPVDIEWAKDGRTHELFIVQARPETVHSRRASQPLRSYHRRGAAIAPSLRGLAVGNGVAHGALRVLKDPRAMSELRPGEVLVTENTDPDWEPIMKRASGIVTERGGRTSHAAIVARELGIPAVVGVANAMQAVATGAEATLSCAEGDVGFLYPGRVDFDIEEVDRSTLPRTRTKIYLNVGNPETALTLAQLPSDGVGLARMEFIFAGWIGIHPMALLHPERVSAAARATIEAKVGRSRSLPDYFVAKLAEGVATLAAAFHPRPVVLRFSDFKTNEYARLLGGEFFEPVEENPMLGWRGASRYVHPNYQEAFLLELAAVRRVREQLGLTNLQVMVPFCRTPAEGRRVLEAMADHGLTRGVNGLKVLVMAELPSNVWLADDFARIFDGFSIGSNDLTQLTLGVDRDSTTVAPLFDERNPSVLRSCAEVIAAARRHARSVGICGQAPSDYPEFAAFLVSQGIDSISLSPDSLLRTLKRVAQAEAAPVDVAPLAGLHADR